MKLESEYGLESVGGLFIFFLVHSSAYVADLIGCKNQMFYTNNRMAKHVINFLGLSLFVTLTLGTGKYAPVELFKRSAMLYAFWLVASKTKFPFGIIAFGLMFIVYMMQMHKD